MICFTSQNQADFDALEEIICANVGIPNDFGTTSFLDVKQALNQIFLFCVKPTGWAGNHNENFTAEQILASADLSKFNEVEFNSSWIPVSEF